VPGEVVGSGEGTFPDVFGMAEGDRNAWRVGDNHGFDGDWRLESMVTMGAKFVKQRR